MRSAPIPKHLVGRILIIAVVLAVLCVLGFALYFMLERVMACPPGGNALLYCNIKGRPYIALILFVSFGLAAVGFIAHALQKRR